MDSTEKLPSTDVVDQEPKESTPRRHLPPVCISFYILLGASLFLYLFCLISESFADTFNQTVSAAVRSFLAWLTNLFPFSLAEYLLLLMPLILVAVIVFGVRRQSDSWRDVLIYCVSLLSALALVLSLFLLAFAPAYRGSTLDKKMGLTRSEVSTDELYGTAFLLADAITRVSGEISFASYDFSIMPYGLDQMNAYLLEAYDKVDDELTFLSSMESRIKPVMLSRALSYTHITGVYTFFTGEANLNVDFPDYTLPFTAAHELAHQRGIAREDEANFVAFLVCSASSDPYIRYSGYLNLFEHVASALYSADPSLYSAVVLSLPRNVLYERIAYSRFFSTYRDSVASEISGAINDTYLTIQGTEGTRSYGMVVDLAVAYFRQS